MKGEFMIKSNKLKTFIVIFLLSLVALFVFMNKKAHGNDGVEMILFYSPSCPHCHDAIAFLDKISPKYPDLTITKHNVATKTGVNYYMYYKNKLNIPGNGVPVAVFGDKYELGFGDEATSGKVYTDNIEELINNSKK